MSLSDASLRKLTTHLAKTGSPEGFVPVKRRKRDNRESRLQQECVKWWRSIGAPAVRVDHRLLYAVPNGAMYGTGISRVIRAKILLAEGLRPGWPDIGIVVARSGFHGLRIETKLPETGPTPDQLAIHALLRQQNYHVVVTRSLDEFIACIYNYFKP